MPDKTNALHDAHVRELRDELQRFSEQLDEHPPHDAHVETRRAAMAPEEQSHRREHTRDFTAAIRRTTFFTAYPNQQIVIRIDAALNEYHDLYAAREQRIDADRAEREKAQALIEKLQQTFDEISQNRLASAAVIDAFCQSDNPAELDERIANLSRAIESLEKPRSKRGRPPTPELDRLTQRLAQLVISARDEAEQAARIDDDTAQNYIGELLKSGNVHRADDTLQKRLASSRGQHYLTIASQQAIELEQLATPIIHPES